VRGGGLEPLERKFLEDAEEFKVIDISTLKIKEE